MRSAIDNDGRLAVEYAVEYDTPADYRPKIRQDRFTGEWVVYIPATSPDHFDILDNPPSSLEDWRHVVDNAPILGPWGDTYWPSFQEATTFLDSIIGT